MGQRRIKRKKNGGDEDWAIEGKGRKVMWQTMKHTQRNTVRPRKETEEGWLWN